MKQCGDNTTSCVAHKIFGIRSRLNRKNHSAKIHACGQIVEPEGRRRGRCAGAKLIAKEMEDIKTGQNKAIYSQMVGSCAKLFP